MSRGRRKIFVGIDYGTTFSGIAYVLPTASNAIDVQIVTEWPGNSGLNNEFLEKVPSTIAYLHENENVAQNYGITGDIWGYELKSNLVSCSWTKLLLDQHARTTEYDDASLKNTVESGLLRLPPGKKAADVVTDYLKKLYEHCMWILGKHYADLLVMTPIEFWFTMPAIWSLKAQKSTREAAIRAGFGSRPKDTIKMITEPEAGVIAAINSPLNNIEGALEPKTGFLVCDCGGGTVDLTSYLVKGTKPTLELHETCPGIGGKCGATSIDRNFHALMRRRFGQPFIKLPIDKKGPGSRFMREFEGLKKNFSGTSHGFDPISLTMPGLERGMVDPGHYDFEYKDVKLSSDDLRLCFDPVVEQILALIAQQVKATTDEGHQKIETIVLIGGFGSSMYLWEKLTGWCFKNGNIRCITPIKPWSAIARGAALRGLEGSKVPSKKCRFHYGTTIDRPFEKNRDTSDDETWLNAKTGKKMVRHCMDWHFARNEEITKDTKKPIEFTQWYNPKKRSRKGQLKFYSCSMNKAPEKKTGQVDHIGTIEVNIQDVDLAQCDRRFQPVESEYDWNKEEVFLIDFKAVVTMDSEDGMMQVAVMWNGKKCGSGKLMFVQDDT